MSDARAHLVLLKSKVLLLKRPELGWRQIQELYADYSASLGPWTAGDIADYYQLDYGDDDSEWPFSRREIESFMDGPGEVLEVAVRPNTEAEDALMARILGRPTVLSRLLFWLLVLVALTLVLVNLRWML